MADLAAPYKLVIWYDGDELVVTSRRFEIGEAVNPHGVAAPGTRAPMLRIWVAGQHAEARGDYLDITSKRLIATLLPLLDEFAGAHVLIRIRAAGAPPRTEYTVSVEPA